MRIDTIRSGFASLTLLGALASMTLILSAPPAKAAVYCKYIGVPKGCVAKPGVVLVAAPVVATAAVVRAPVVATRVAVRAPVGVDRVATPGVGARGIGVRPGTPLNRGGPQRLTHDLHDGISGHLVSIIAMAERSDTGARTIELAAREALDDLRLVIYSLELGDRELPLALANFRERLTPQLQRIGVALDWSTAKLPEVSGVTPGNALTVLRVLQEAITNALNHGPARTITIRGDTVDGGRAAIMVENDGRPFKADGRGHGLENMRRRAHELGGELRIEAFAEGTRLTLLLPTALPDVQEEGGKNEMV